MGGRRRLLPVFSVIEGWPPSGRQWTGRGGFSQRTTDKSRTGAHRFYERLGFTASHEGMKLILDRA
jgi:hypothetical protein